MNDFDKLMAGMREASVVFAPDDEKPQWVITTEHNLAFDLGFAISFGEKLVKGDGTPPVSVRHENVPGQLRRKSLKLNRLGEQFSQLMCVDFLQIAHYYPMHNFHPYFQIVHSALTERNLLGLNFQRNLLTDTDVIAWADRINGCCHDLRHTLQSTAIRRKVDDFSRNARKNNAALSKFFKAVLRLQGAAKVYRAELFYRKGLNWPNGTDQVEIEYKTVRSHITALRKSLDKMHEDYLLGHAMRLDHSLERGYVVHIIVFVDPSMTGQKNENAISLIGQKWLEITAGKGAYYEYGGDIIEPQASFKRCGTGLCFAGNVVHQAALQDAALFLTMRDRLVQVKVPGRHRTLWRSITPDIPPKAKATQAVGAPSFPVTLMPGNSISPLSPCF